MAVEAAGGLAALAGAWPTAPCEEGGVAVAGAAVVVPGTPGAMGDGALAAFEGAAAVSAGRAALSAVRAAESAERAARSAERMGGSAADAGLVSGAGDGLISGGGAGLFSGTGVGFALEFGAALATTVGSAALRAGTASDAGRWGGLLAVSVRAGSRLSCFSCFGGTLAR